MKPSDYPTIEETPETGLSTLVKLSEEVMAALNQSRMDYQAVETDLEQLMNVLRDIDDGASVTQLANIREMTQMNILRRETLATTLQNIESLGSYLEQNVQIEGGNKYKIMEVSLDHLLNRVTQTRAHLLHALQRTSENPLNQQQIMSGVNGLPDISNLPVPNIGDFSPDSNPHVTWATGDRKESPAGKKSTERVRNQAHTDITSTVEIQNLRILVLYQMIIHSLINLQERSRVTLDEIHSVSEMINQKGISDELAMQLFEHIDSKIDTASGKILELLIELMEKREIALDCLDHEKGVDSILSSIIPTEELQTLRQTIRKRMPEGEKKEQALNIIAESIERRHQKNRAEVIKRRRQNQR
jgi:hypothetical protein